MRKRPVHTHAEEDRTRITRSLCRVFIIVVIIFRHAIRADSKIGNSKKKKKLKPDRIPFAFVRTSGQRVHDKREKKFYSVGHIATIVIIVRGQVID